MGGEMGLYGADIFNKVGMDVLHAACLTTYGIEHPLQCLIHRYLVLNLIQHLLVQQHILTQRIAQL